MKNQLKISLEFSRRLCLKTFPVILFCLIVDSQQLLGQFHDDFSDGDFTTSPVWSGAVEKFSIDQGVLRLQAPAEGGIAHLSTSSSAFYNASWEFVVNLDFNPSSGNLARVYVASDQPDLSAPLNGYFILIGDTPDEISLYRQSGNERTKIIDGADGRVNFSATTVKIRLTRDAFGMWELYSDVDATGAFILEGSATDISHTVSSYFGVYCVYTSTRSDKFYFDDFNVTGESFIDMLPPHVESVDAVSEHALLVSFSEELDSATAVRVSNFHISNGIGFPAVATLGIERSLVTLQLDSALTNGRAYNLQVDSVADLAGNRMGQETKNFLFFIPVEATEKDIIVTEFFPDPTPSAGLPEAEFIELFNRSHSPFDLAGWKIGDGSTVVALNSMMLLPGEYLILSSLSAKPFYDTIGMTMGLSVLPSLNNSSDVIRLTSPEGRAIDSVSYSTSWYRDDEKKDGGWTLELVDPDDNCRAALNWIASTSATGGTPGGQNSVYDTAVDVIGPRLINVSRSAEAVMEFVFDEALQMSAPVAGNFIINPPVTITGVTFADAERKSIFLSLGEDLDSAKTYNIKVSDISDCPGNPIQAEHSSFVLKLDTISPKVLSQSITSQTDLHLLFSERLEPASAEAIANYFLPTGPTILTAVLEADGRIVKITFETPLSNGVGYTIQIENVSDLAGNEMLPEVRSLRYFVPVPATHKDIIFTELLPDPVPVIALPETEFVEIFNRSEKPFELMGWKLADGNSEAFLPAHIILPGDYLVLCSPNRVGQFATAKALGVVGFPSLTNAGEPLRLFTPVGLLIDSVHYSSSWYGDDEKKDGGWTLELVDPDDDCRAALNWIASTSATGGTPGGQNSVYDTAVDATGPRLVNVSRTAEALLEFEFDERLQKKTPVVGNFVVDPSVGITAVAFTDPENASVALSLLEDLDSAKTYKFEVSDITDCPGNPIQAEHSSFVLKLDTISPKILFHSIVSQTELHLAFSERIDPASADEVTNFFLATGPKVLTTVVDADGRVVKIIFEKAFSNGVEYTIQIENLRDRAGNVMLPETRSFRYFVPVPAISKDVIFTELLPDPAPARGLPETEFAEIFNRSEKPFEMLGWKLADENSEAVLPGHTMLPGEYLVLCAPGRVGQFANRKALGVVGFPSLSNSGESLRLITADGLLVDSVNYSTSWYRDDEKKDGGWSLELIDPENTCAEEENWSASEAEPGGTPGGINSIAANKPDLTGPELTSAFPLSDSAVMLTFNEKLDRSVPSADGFVFEPAVPIETLEFLDGSLRSLRADLSEALAGGIAYRVTVSKVYDCAGNEIQQESNSQSFALPEPALANDIAINEILFNPRSTGVDFVEVYNKSAKYINLKGWQISNFEGDSVRNAQVVSKNDFLFAPGQYLVLTQDGNVLKGEYLQGKEETFYEGTLPSFPDDEGSVALVDADTNFIDRFTYSDTYHSSLLKDEEGVSLERISLSVATADARNWRSAATTSGYATPGFLNSNSRGDALAEDAIQIEPEVFAPQSGLSDFALIRFSFDKGGYVANVRIIDPQGREIKRIANNEILGTEGFFRWDGDNDNGSTARIGAYMVWVEIFDAAGTVKTYRKRVVIAGAFR